MNSTQHTLEGLGFQAIKNMSSTQGKSTFFALATKIANFKFPSISTLKSQYAEKVEAKASMREAERLGKYAADAKVDMNKKYDLENKVSAIRNTYPKGDAFREALSSICYAAGSENRAQSPISNANHAYILNQGLRFAAVLDGELSPNHAKKGELKDILEELRTLKDDPSQQKFLAANATDRLVRIINDAYPK